MANRTSTQNLRKRVRHHYRGNAAGSTLRLTLGCLLGLELRRVGGGKRMTFRQGRGSRPQCGTEGRCSSAGTGVAHQRVGVGLTPTATHRHCRSRIDERSLARQQVAPARRAWPRRVWACVPRYDRRSTAR
ncbi:GIY-YIG nuclease family protein [Streptomyces chartreusis]|uniref:GIY-YIG nuclease family protein n=1 Tax=Streptomyces chartreusis TaxID=1969 RepID=UPI003137EE43